MSKQDRQQVRSAADLERKFNFGKTFAEMLGLINDARDAVDSVESTLRSEIKEQVTSITRDTERIVMAALESYAETGDLEELEQTVKSELSVMADKISMNFDTVETKLSDVNGELQTVTETMSKHFDFSVDGLLIKSGENGTGLLLDSDLIQFQKNGSLGGNWDGEDFRTGNLIISLNEKAQLGNFAFVPRSNGSLDFLKVGG